MKSSTTSHCLTLLRYLYMQSRCMLRQDCMTADTASHGPRCFSRVEQQITTISRLQYGSTLPIDDAISLKLHYIWYGMISSRYNMLCIIRSYGGCGGWRGGGGYGKLTLAFCAPLSTLLPALSVACCASLPTEPACDLASCPACLPLLARSLV